VSFPGKEEHVRKMHGSLLPPRYEGKSEKNHAVLGTTHASASPGLGVASRVGWATEAADAGKKA